jgi:hypothetical protein
MKWDGPRESSKKKSGSPRQIPYCREKGGDLALLGPFGAAKPGALGGLFLRIPWRSQQGISLGEQGIMVPCSAGDQRLF